MQTTQEKMEKDVEDIQLNSKEAQVLQDAFKTEEFCKLFSEYVEEVTDPANQKIYEDEVTLMEKERGFDVTFLKPEPGYVIKTNNKSKKAFINICKDNNSGVAYSKKAIGPNNVIGYNWEIPMLLSKPREDLDNKGEKCMVYDVMFNPQTFRMAKTNRKFKDILEESALSYVEKSFNVTFDRDDIRYPRLKYKGMAPRNVLRKKTELYDCKTNVDDEFYQMVSQNMDPKSNCREMEEKHSKLKNNTNSSVAQKVDSLPYKLKYRDYADFSDYLNETGPNKSEAIVEIPLPLVNLVSELEIEIVDKSIIIRSVVPKHSYNVKINLTFTINEPESKACFNPDSKNLTLILPLLKPKFTSNDELLTKHSPIPSSDDVKEEKSISVTETNEPCMKTTSPTLSSNTDNSKLINEFRIISSSGLITKDIKFIHNDDILHTEDEISNNGLHLCQYQDCCFKTYNACNLLKCEGSESYDTLKFQIHVKYVCPSSLQIFCCACKSSILFIFDVIGPSYVPISHVWQLNFWESGKILPDKITVTVTDENLTIYVKKHDDCVFPWKSYKFGIDKNNFVEYKFMEMVVSSKTVGSEELEVGHLVPIDCLPHEDVGAEAVIADSSGSPQIVKRDFSETQNLLIQNKLEVYAENDICECDGSNDLMEKKHEKLLNKSRENSKLLTRSFSECDQLSSKTDIPSQSLEILTSKSKSILGTDEMQITNCFEPRILMGDQKADVQDREIIDSGANKDLSTITSLQVSNTPGSAERILINSSDKNPLDICQKCENNPKLSIFKNKPSDYCVVLDNTSDVISVSSNNSSDMMSDDKSKFLSSQYDNANSSMTIFKAGKKNLFNDPDINNETLSDSPLIEEICDKSECKNDIAMTESLQHSPNNKSDNSESFVYTLESGKEKIANVAQNCAEHLASFCTRNETNSENCSTYDSLLSEEPSCDIGLFSEMYQHESDKIVVGNGKDIHEHCIEKKQLFYDEKLHDSTPCLNEIVESSQQILSPKISNDKRQHRLQKEMDDVSKNVTCTNFRKVDVSISSKQSKYDTQQKKGIVFENAIMFELD